MKPKKSQTRASLFVTMHFPPEPVELPLELARLVRECFGELRVFSAVPNYPAGKVQNGFKAYRYSYSNIDGINITYCPIYPSHDGSVIKRLVTYFSFVITSTIPIVRKSFSVDSIFVYGSPLLAAVPARIASLLCRKPYIIYATDIWPDAFAINLSNSKIMRNGFISKFNFWWTNSLYKHAMCVIAINNESRENLISRGISKERLEIIVPWVNETEADSGSNLPRKKGQIAYVGNLGKSQNLESLIQGFNLSSPQELRLIIAGTGTEAEKLRSLIENLGDDRISILGAVTIEKASQLISESDVAAVSLASSSALDLAIPSKVQFAMIRQTPVLGICAGATRGLILKANAGWVASPTNIQEITETIEKIFETTFDDRRIIGINGGSYYLEHLSKGYAREVINEISSNINGRGK